MLIRLLVLISPLPVLLHSMAPSFRLYTTHHKFEMGSSTRGAGDRRRHNFFSGHEQVLLGQRS